MQLDPLALAVEAAYPLAGHGIPREVKRRAVQRVLVDGWNWTAAAAEAGCKILSVQRWVEEFEARLIAAKESVDKRLATEIAKE